MGNDVTPSSILFKSIIFFPKLFSVLLVKETYLEKISHFLMEILV
jgi:hypothetical protein